MQLRDQPLKQTDIVVKFKAYTIVYTRDKKLCDHYNITLKVGEITVCNVNCNKSHILVVDAKSTGGSGKLA